MNRFFQIIQLPIAIAIAISIFTSMQVASASETYLKPGFTFTRAGETLDRVIRIESDRKITSVWFERIPANFKLKKISEGQIGSRYYRTYNINWTSDKVTKVEVRIRVRTNAGVERKILTVRVLEAGESGEGFSAKLAEIVDRYWTQNVLAWFETIFEGDSNDSDSQRQIAGK